ncbi:Sec-independent protein translocase TatB [Zhihengliuella sp.]|uniref:Sec-independent protein translocase TatB n=1 Tax=Zhihengliuella sp. TaxID=1954483 RepID=UPI0028111F16|nr:Sec-independent protein translocase TatB [Zhihengliuella sp.]
MFGINGGEFLILALLAVLVLGPDKLPGYAQQLAELVKNVRRMAQGAKEQLRDEVGDDIADIDWRKLDPRQYDPRRIIKEALLDDFEDAARAARETPKATARKSVSAGAARQSIETTPGSAAGASGAMGGAAALGAGAALGTTRRLAPGDPAPFDVEAT